MSHKVLAVVETAYRATLEEQDDPVLWLTQALKGAGADIHVLLRGAAVNYAVREQDASGLTFGEKAQTQPPRLERDLASLAGKGATIYVLKEDVAARGLRPEELAPALELIGRESIPALFRGFDHIWHW
jgi:DsrE/DsrF-like family